MTNAASQILQSALKLTEEERNEIAQRLFESIDGDDLGLSVEQLREIDRRVQEIENGTTQMIPMEEAFRDAYRSLE